MRKDTFSLRFLFFSRCRGVAPYLYYLKLAILVYMNRKKRLRFYGHTSRLPANRLIDKVLTSIKTLKNIQWMIEEVNLDLDRARIFPSETSDRNLYRSKINRWEFNWREIKKTTGIKNERGSTEKK